jgi:multiple sugar transport system substrate-binding protein
MWNRANPDAPLKVDIVTGTTVDQKTNMLAAARSGMADIVNLDIIDIPEFAPGLIEPVRLDRGLFLGDVLKPGAIKDKEEEYWAAPFNTDVGVLFERASDDSAPNEQSDLVQVLSRLGSSKLAGFVGQLGSGSSASSEAFTINVLEHVISQDPDLLPKDVNFADGGIPFYEAARWQEALAPLRAAIADRRVISADNESTTLKLFMSSTGPRLMRHWPVAYRELQQNSDSDVRRGRIKVRAFPTAILGGQSLALVKKTTPNPHATRLINFLTSDEAQKVLAERGLAPTRKAAYNDPNLQATVPHLETIRQAVENARMRPIHRNYAQFTKAVANHIRPIMHTKDPVPSAFVDEIRAALSS